VLITHICREDGDSYIKGQSTPVPVGRQLDIDIPRKYTSGTSKVNIRVFWPIGARPTENGGKLPCFMHIRELIYVIDDGTVG
jgi:hypothetical protein